MPSAMRVQEIGLTVNEQVGPDAEQQQQNINMNRIRLLDQPRATSR